jgi:hypothetical protein
MTHEPVLNACVIRGDIMISDYFGQQCKIIQIFFGFKVIKGKRERVKDV